MSHPKAMKNSKPLSGLQRPNMLNPTYKFQALAVGATKDCDPQFTLSWVEIRENQYEPSRIEAYYRVFDDAK